MFNGRILTIDDQDEDLEIMNHILHKQNYETVSAANGIEALEILEKDQNFDVILLDRMMPKMDGITFLRRIKENAELHNLPVIMQTAADEDKQVMEGIDAGVYWYITKPFSHQLLVTLVKSAMRMNRKMKRKNEMADFYIESRRKLKMGMEKLKYCELEFQKLKEAKNIANAISCIFPQSLSMVGAISEILVNSVEHGNLGISFDEKSNYLLEGVWEEQIEYRSKLNENKEKFVTVEVTKSPSFVEMKVKDCGSGFDWKPFLTLDKERALKANGRGIYLASLEFDNIEYKGIGNEVICTKYLN
jgi:DNA-binding response OmpR family regulator